jgi:DNA-binding PucR family transcriptional regulator
MPPHDADVQDFVDRLAEELERAIVVEDRRHGLIAHSGHSGEVDTVRARTVISRQAPPEAIAWVTDEGLQKAQRPIRLRPNAEIGAVSRVAVPIRANGRIIGFLAVLDPDQTFTPEAFERCSDAAEVLARLLQELLTTRDRAHSQEKKLVETLVTADDPADRRAAAETLFRLAPTGAGRFCAIVVRGGEEGDRAPRDFAKAVRRALPTRSIAMSEIGPDLILAMEIEGDAAAVAAAVHDAIAARESSNGQHPVVPIVALGDRVRDVADLPRSYRHACLAAQISERMPRKRSEAVDWSAMGVFQVLVHVPATELGNRETENRLALLNERPDLLQTLEVYLDLAGDAGRSAKELHVHRASLYYRLEKITELTGLDLKSGSDRLDAHLSLKALRLAGLLETDGFDRT